MQIRLAQTWPSTSNRHPTNNNQHPFGALGQHLSSLFSHRHPTHWQGSPCGPGPAPSPVPGIASPPVLTHSQPGMWLSLFPSSSECWSLPLVLPLSLKTCLFIPFLGNKPKHIPCQLCSPWWPAFSHHSSWANAGHKRLYSSAHLLTYFLQQRHHCYDLLGALQLHIRHEGWDSHCERP